ncbi:MAG: hypothetical protein O9262_10000 [Cyclobacteriaceae bacterium]|nr:hypothetical protein [Cyclobacteriaceae bacterium]
MKDQIFRLITKYALLLTVFYILSFAFTRLIIEFDFNTSLIDSINIRQSAPLLFDIILNLITVYLVNQDRKRYKVKTKYVILATIVFRPLGVFAFLLFFHFQDQQKDKV